MSGGSGDSQPALAFGAVDERSRTCATMAPADERGAECAFGEHAVSSCDDDAEQDAGSEDSSSSGSDDEEDDDDDEDDDGEVCAICLSSFRGQEIGNPESCDHNFCLQHILEWANNVTTCPVDRQTFTMILVRREPGGCITRRIAIEKKDPLHQQPDDDPTYCEVCGRCDREDRLLLCDGCDSGYHLDCLDPPLLRVPEDQWFCSECVPADTAATSNVDSSIMAVLAAEAGISQRELVSLLDGHAGDSVPSAAAAVTRRMARTQLAERIRRRTTTVMSSESTTVADDETTLPGASGVSSARGRRASSRSRSTTGRGRSRGRRKCRLSDGGGGKKPRKKRARKSRRRRSTKRQKRVRDTVDKYDTTRQHLRKLLAIRRMKPGQLEPPVIGTRGSGQSETMGAAVAAVSAVSSVRRQRSAVPTLHLFGRRDDLLLAASDPDSEPDDGDGPLWSTVGGVGGLCAMTAARAAVPRPLRAGKCVLARQQTLPAAAADVAQPSPDDVLATILSNQSLLLSDSRRMRIERDGRLSVVSATRRPASVTAGGVSPRVPLVTAAAASVALSPTASSSSSPSSNTQSNRQMDSSCAPEHAHSVASHSTEGTSHTPVSNAAGDTATSACGAGVQTARIDQHSCGGSAMKLARVKRRTDAAPASHDSKADTADDDGGAGRCDPDAVLADPRGSLVIAAGCSGGQTPPSSGVPSPVDAADTSRPMGSCVGGTPGGRFFDGARNNIGYATYYAQRRSPSPSVSVSTAVCAAVVGEVGRVAAVAGASECDVDLYSDIESAGSATSSRGEPVDSDYHQDMDGPHVVSAAIAAVMASSCVDDNGDGSGSMRYASDVSSEDELVIDDSVRRSPEAVADRTADVSSQVVMSAMAEVAAENKSPPRGRLTTEVINSPESFHEDLGSQSATDCEVHSSPTTLEAAAVLRQIVNRESSQLPSLPDAEQISDSEEPNDFDDGMEEGEIPPPTPPPLPPASTCDPPPISLYSRNTHVRSPLPHSGGSSSNHEFYADQDVIECLSTDHNDSKIVHDGCGVEDGEIVDPSMMSVADEPGELLDDLKSFLKQSEAVNTSMKVADEGIKEKYSEKNESKLLCQNVVAVFNGGDDDDDAPTVDEEIRDFVVVEKTHATSGENVDSTTPQISWKKISKNNKVRNYREIGRPNDWVGSDNKDKSSSFRLPSVNHSNNLDKAEGPSKSKEDTLRGKSSLSTDDVRHVITDRRERKKRSKRSRSRSRSANAGGSSSSRRRRQHRRKSSRSGSRSKRKNDSRDRKRKRASSPLERRRVWISRSPVSDESNNKVSRARVPSKSRSSSQTDGYSKTVRRRRASAESRPVHRQKTKVNISKDEQARKKDKESMSKAVIADGDNLVVSVNFPRGEKDVTPNIPRLNIPDNVITNDEVLPSLTDAVPSLPAPEAEDQPKLSSPLPSELAVSVNPLRPESPVAIKEKHLRNNDTSMNRMGSPSKSRSKESTVGASLSTKKSNNMPSVSSVKNIDAKLTGVSRAAYRRSRRRSQSSSSSSSPHRDRRVVRSALRRPPQLSPVDLDVLEVPASDTEPIVITDSDGGFSDDDVRPASPSGCATSALTAGGSTAPRAPAGSAPTRSPRGPRTPSDPDTPPHSSAATTMTTSAQQSTTRPQQLSVQSGAGDTTFVKFSLTGRLAATGASVRPLFNPLMAASDAADVDEDDMFHVSPRTAAPVTTTTATATTTAPVVRGPSTPPEPAVRAVNVDASSYDPFEPTHSASPASQSSPGATSAADNSAVVDLATAGATTSTDSADSAPASSVISDSSDKMSLFADLPPPSSGIERPSPVLPTPAPLPSECSSVALPDISRPPPPPLLPPSLPPQPPILEPARHSPAVERPSSVAVAAASQPTSRSVSSPAGVCCSSVVSTAVATAVASSPPSGCDMELDSPASACSPRSPDPCEGDDLFEPPRTPAPPVDEAAARSAVTLPAHPHHPHHLQRRQQQQQSARRPTFDSLFSSKPRAAVCSTGGAAQLSLSRRPVAVGRTLPKSVGAAGRPSHASAIRQFDQLLGNPAVDDEKISFDDIPNSAVDMEVQEKFLKKLNRQERVIEEVKLVLKPFYHKRTVTKLQYKEILRKAVPKICHSRTGEINPIKIQALVVGYVKKYKHINKHSADKNKTPAGSAPAANKL